MPCSRSRCGMSAGSDSARATAIAPRSPAHAIRCSHVLGIARAHPILAIAREPAAEQAVDDQGARDEHADQRHEARNERVRELRDAHREADQQEHDRRHQERDELPDRVDRILRPWRSPHAARGCRRRARRRRSRGCPTGRGARQAGSCRTRRRARSSARSGGRPRGQAPSSRDTRSRRRPPSTTTVVTTSPTTSSIGATSRPNDSTAIAKMTMPVPSLKRLSASTSVVSRRGARRRLKTAMTAAGSVAASIVPTRNARANGSPVATFSASATVAGRHQDADRRENRDRRQVRHRGREGRSGRRPRRSAPE